MIAYPVSYCSLVVQAPGLISRVILEELQSLVPGSADETSGVGRAFVEGDISPAVPRSHLHRIEV